MMKHVLVFFFFSFFTSLSILWIFLNKFSVPMQASNLSSGVDSLPDKSSKLIYVVKNNFSPAQRSEQAKNKIESIFLLFLCNGHKTRKIISLRRLSLFLLKISYLCASPWNYLSKWRFIIVMLAIKVSANERETAREKQMHAHTYTVL